MLGLKINLTNITSSAVANGDVDAVCDFTHFAGPRENAPTYSTFKLRRTLIRTEVNQGVA